ncbi:IS4 family transposase [Polaromonas glacialis]
MRSIAQRGGFLGRKHDGKPGARTIWWVCRRLPSSSRVLVIPAAQRWVT